jgi:RNA polymerase sigma-70 factor (ECF subfamily)
MGKEKARALDAYLVSSARLRDRHALGLLVLRWHDKLFAHAWRLLRDEERAKDAVQDGWAEMLRGLSRLRDDGAFAAWAYRIVSRRCARQIGRIQAERRVAEEIAAYAVEEDFSEPSTLDTDTVQKAIAALPGEQQATVALFYLEDLSVAEVAVALDVPAGTVKTRLMHARSKMRAALDGGQ